MQTRQFIGAVVVGCTFFSGVGPALQAADELQAQLQAVNAQGLSTWTKHLPFTIEGVVLNNPEEYMDTTAQFVDYQDGQGMFQLGGQWQVFIQAVAPGDRGGTALWMGQNYGNLPFLRDGYFSYTDPEWTAEMERVNHDVGTGHRFRKGDRVRVTARGSLFREGKQFINEEHDKDPNRDFTLELITTAYGLPAPEVITLSDVVRVDDGNPGTHEAIFDPTRATGGEYYQGLRVRINGLTLADSAGWGKTVFAERQCQVADGQGRYLKLRLPLLDLGPAPTTRFDAIGVWDQASGSGTDGTFGYELFVQEIVLPQLPSLSVARDGAQVVIQWPVLAGNAQLEAATNLADGTWLEVTNRPVELDHRLTVKLEATAPRQFYRLHQR